MDMDCAAPASRRICAVMPPLPTLAVATFSLLCAACAVPDADAAAKAQPRPPLHDEFLDHLTGDWRLTRSVRGTTTHDEVSARWILGHQFVRLHMIALHRPPASEPIVLIAHDH